MKQMIKLEGEVGQSSGQMIIKKNIKNIFY